VVGVGCVEGDAQVDLDVPAGDVHVVDQQSQQVFSLRVVQLVDDAGDLSGEVFDAAAEQVSVSQGGALGCEAGAFGLQVVVAGGDLAGTALQLR